MQSTYEERSKLVVKLKEEGRTFQEIADILNLTRQRVHQIYKKVSQEQKIPS